jgi:uncharacterized protein YdaT
MVVVPWNESYFPRSMANLPPMVRAKAVEIANALLAQGYDEGRAIRIAIAQAKRWAARFDGAPDVVLGLRRQ